MSTPPHHKWKTIRHKSELEGVAAPLEPLTAEKFYLQRHPQQPYAELEPEAWLDFAQAYAAAVSKNLTKRSMTWGDLPEAVRVLCGNLKPPVQPHEWDNMNISEQRDWAVEQLDISEQFLN